ncbi:hypothetical protein NDU88_011332 [Pleurodeles waltl]|uniref:Uncharacterized protein n=2 Tax=Pleurodeles waltl TaxID=8319 RepID=A0AAV7R319_PLEWA|nr:hypothetical protein NDU88_011332 [Pleurodeles waltl]
MAGAPACGAQTPDKPKSASEHRKSSKPIMEKRRRARINESLGQLKTLILDALKKDSSRHSKLEKADILEMTVKHLRNLQRVQMTAALSADPTVLGKYRAGFNECMNEVTRFLSTCEGVNTEVRTRLLGHLSGCLGGMAAMNYPQHVQPGPGPCKLNSSETPKVYGGFQLVPATDGQFAFLIPSHSPVLQPLCAVNGGQQPTSPGQGLPTFAHKLPPVSQALSPRGLSTGPESVWRPW